MILDPNIVDCNEPYDAVISASEDSTPHEDVCDIPQHTVNAIKHELEALRSTGQSYLTFAPTIEDGVKKIWQEIPQPDRDKMNSHSYRTAGDISKEYVPWCRKLIQDLVPRLEGLL